MATNSLDLSQITWEFCMCDPSKPFQNKSCQRLYLGYHLTYCSHMMSSIPFTFGSGIQGNGFEIVLSKMVAILFLPHCITHYVLEINKKSSPDALVFRVTDKRCMYVFCCCFSLYWMQLWRTSPLSHFLQWLWNMLYKQGQYPGFFNLIDIFAVHVNFQGSQPNFGRSFQRNTYNTLCVAIGPMETFYKGFYRISRGPGLQAVGPQRPWVLSQYEDAVLPV